MNVGFRHVRQVEVHHVADAVDIDAAGGDISRDQGANIAVAERRKHALTMVLRFVAVNGVCRYSSLDQALYHLVGAVLGPGENQGPVDRFLLQDLRQRGGLGGMVELDNALRHALGRRSHRGDGDPCGIAQHALGKVGDVLRHGGGEEQRLTPWRQQFADLLDVRNKAHVEHAVGFVEHQELDLAELQRITLDKVEQAAGGRDQDFHALHQGANLTAHRDAADRQRG